MLSRDVQPENASSPILVTESGMTIFSSDAQSMNAPSLMLVTEFGIEILF